MSIRLPDREVPVVRRSDVIVVGGGPAGVAAAVAAARGGVSVTLLERYAALGGLASGGMVLVLDDMCNGDEVTVGGIVDEYVERMHKRPHGDGSTPRRTRTRRLTMCSSSTPAWTAVRN